MLDKEIVTDFQQEAKELLGELEKTVETLEEAAGRFPAQELELFAQRIDRIMGAAQTLNQLDPGHLGLKRIGAISQLCKQLGYKASEYQLSALVPLFAAFWAETLEVLGELIDHVNDEAKSQALAEAFASTVQNRLNWLSGKVAQLAPTSKVEQMNQTQVDDLLESLRKR